MPSARLICLVLAACAGFILAAAAASARPPDRRLTVTNGTDAAIEFVYIAQCGAGAWGKDRLGAREMIEPGRKRVFSVAGSADASCCHDLRAMLHTGASRQKLEADLCREPEWIVR